MPSKSTAQEIHDFRKTAKICAEITTTTPMKGTIKTLTEKGFGFITPEGQGNDVFFHMSSIIDTNITFEMLRQGDVVEFDIEDSPKGPRAANVRKA